MTPRDQLLGALERVRAAGYEVRFHDRWDDPVLAGRGWFDPKFVVLHHTAGLRSLGWLTAGPTLFTGPNGGKVPGSHVLVNRDGSIDVLSRFVTYHAGKGRGFGVPADRMNEFSWGIEIEDLGVGQTMTPEQVDSAAALSAGLLVEMGRGVQALIEHEQWSSTGKVDTRYTVQFWRDHTQTHMDEENDMRLTDKVPGISPQIREAAGLPDEPTVADVFLAAVRGLVVAKRAEARSAAQNAALSAAVQAAGAGADLAAVEAAAKAGAEQALAGLTLKAEQA